MNEEKLQLINKLFENATIRTVWDRESEKYYISIIDVVSILTNSSNGRKYWNKLKQRLKEEGCQSVANNQGLEDTESREPQPVTNCHQLKLKATDGKYRLTDVADIEGIFRIIESIPSKNAEPFKRWLARLGRERIDETFDPSLAIQRATDLYRQKGYDEQWIKKRLEGIVKRKALTDAWQENGVERNEFAILTNEIYKTWSGKTAREYKEYKGLRKENLRDNMDDIELILTDLSEEATKRLVEKHHPSGLEENKTYAKKGGNVAKVAKESLEEELGESVVTRNNQLSYNYSNQPKKLRNK